LIIKEHVSESKQNFVHYLSCQAVRAEIKIPIRTTWPYA